MFFVLSSCDFCAILSAVGQLPFVQPRGHATFFLLKIFLRSELKRIFATSFRWVSRSKSATKVALNCKSYLSLGHSRLCSKSLNPIFPTTYEISKSSLVGHQCIARSFPKGILEETITRVTCSIRTRILYNGRRKSSEVWRSQQFEGTTL